MDTMGLGKTFEALGLLVVKNWETLQEPSIHWGKPKPTLIIVPNAVIPDWKHAINTGLPDRFKVTGWYDGVKPAFNAKVLDTFDDPAFEIVLTTRSTISRIVDVKLLEPYSNKFGLIIADEVHEAKTWTRTPTRISWPSVGITDSCLRRHHKSTPSMIWKAL